VLVDSPISGYFTECLGHGSLDETRVEFIRNSVYKVYLEDFISSCNILQGKSKKFSSLLVSYGTEVLIIRLNHVFSESVVL